MSTSKPRNPAEALQKGWDLSPYLVLFYKNNLKYIIYRGGGTPYVKARGWGWGVIHSIESVGKRQKYRVPPTVG